MAQNRCTRDLAFEMLRRASSNRNRKLSTVAREVIANLTGGNGQISTHFDD